MSLYVLIRQYIPGMCPGLGELWLHKGVLNLISMLKLCLGFLVDTLFCVKWQADILVVCSGGHFI